MKAFQFTGPKSLAQATRGLASNGAARVISGGTDLLHELKEGTVEVERLVSLQDLTELRGIALSDRGIHIGAMVTLAEIESHQEIIEQYPALAQAAASVATPQIRNVGTLGGNLCQRPRCWYYRNPLTVCRKKGGDDCFASESGNKYHAIFGGSSCHIVHPSDTAVALIALGAEVTFVNDSGVHTLPLESFFAGPEVDVQRENVLGPGDILTEVFVPRPAQGHQSLYLKAKERPAIDFALVSVAISAQIVGGTIRSSRIVLGGVAPTPIRASLAEQAIEGRHIRGVNADVAGTAAVQGASPLSENGYKVALCSGLVARAVRSLR